MRDKAAAMAGATSQLAARASEKLKGEEETKVALASST